MDACLGLCAAMCQAQYTPAVNLTAVYIAIGNGHEANFGVSHSEKDAETCCSQCYQSSYNPPGAVNIHLNLKTKTLFFVNLTSDHVLADWLANVVCSRQCRSATESSA